MKKISKKAVIAMAISLSAVALCVILYFSIKIPVPSVKGVDSAEGIKALKNSTFIVHVEEEYHDTVPKGVIISQDNVSGAKLRVLSAVTVTVSKGIEHFEVPNVLKKPVLEAKEILEKLKFDVTVTEVSNPNFAGGVVISQSLTVGKSLPKGTKIEIIVCKSTEKVKAPNITGKTLEEAKKIVEGAGLILRTDFKCSNSVKEDRIISQDVKAGEAISKNGTIKAVVSAGVANTVGNTPSNSEAWGHIAAQGNWVYHAISNNSYYLLKMKNDGTQRQVLLREPVSSLNVMGEWIYYNCMSSSGGGIYKIRIDGTGKTKIDSQPYYFMHVQGDWIYMSSGLGGSMYRMKTDGSNKEVISNDECWNINIIGDWIYYINKRDSLVYKMRTNGADRTKIGGGIRVHYFAVVGDTIVGNDEDEIFCFGTDGSNMIRKKDDGNFQRTFFHADGGWIYYRKIDFENNRCLFYKIKPDLSQKTKLLDIALGNSTNEDIWVANDWLYYINYEENNDIYRVKTDGSQKTEKV